MKTVICPLCGKEVPELMYPLHEATDELVIVKIKAKFPDWQPEAGICDPCLERFRRLDAVGG